MLENNQIVSFMKNILLIIILVIVNSSVLAQEVTATWGRHGGCTGRGICGIGSGADRSLDQNQSIGLLYYTANKSVVLRISRDSLLVDTEDYLLNEQFLKDANDQYFLSIDKAVALDSLVIALTGKSPASQLRTIATGSYRVHISEAYIDIFLVE